MTIVTGIFTVGASITFVTVHTLAVKSFSAQGNVLCIRFILFSEGTGRNIVVAAQTRFFTGKTLLVFSPELGVKSYGMTAAARNGCFLTDIVMVTIGTFVSIFISMDKMGENNPAATVIQYDSGRVFLNRGRKKETGCSRNGQNSNN